MAPLIGNQVRRRRYQVPWRAARIHANWDEFGGSQVRWSTVIDLATRLRVLSMAWKLVEASASQPKAQNWCSPGERKAIVDRSPSGHVSVDHSRSQVIFEPSLFSCIFLSSRLPNLFLSLSTPFLPISTGSSSTTPLSRPPRAHLDITTTSISTATATAASIELVPCV